MSKGYLALAMTVTMSAACSNGTYTSAGMCGGRLLNWQSPSRGIGELATLQPIRITKNNELRWNGAIISMILLDDYLGRMRKLSPEPQMILHVEDGASCSTVKAVRSSMEAHLGCFNSRACGEGRGWRRWPGAKPEDF